MQKYRQTDAFKKYQQKYQQTDAFKKSQQKYRQTDAFKKYQQSDAFKKSRQKYLQSDAYKKYQQKYRQTDAYKASNRISNLKEHYLKERKNCEKIIRKYSIPPIAIEGKLIMINEIIENINIIEKHTEGMDKLIKQRTIDTMLTQLLQKEGILVSRRKQIAPIHSPSLKAGVSLEGT